MMGKRRSTRKGGGVVIQRKRVWRKCFSGSGRRKCDRDSIEAIDEIRNPYAS